MERNGKRYRFVGRAVAVGAAALVLAGVVALSAQARGRGWDGREPSADRVASRMAERLGLSAEQKAKVQEILTQGQAKRTEIFEEGRKRMELLRQETEKRFATVLTPEQIAKLKQYREERRNRRDRRRDCGPCPDCPDHGIPGGPPPDRN